MSRWHGPRCPFCDAPLVGDASARAVARRAYQNRWNRGKRRGLSGRPPRERSDAYLKGWRRGAKARRSRSPDAPD